ncbi:hypothetical protein [Cesiribacter andamanensis]|uniref:VWFA domain-containing protein n=1 Tax=Cesiribacter andamanensis AMV16 TaxID=1279009 RepID=M7P0I8_9BACT|nr:hypothetical protein [Cesiribacter andamanensis]EMR04114.1 hypothetical protein ADICEAN_00737 [Cesiribacter andamanensis AMV16]
MTCRNLFVFCLGILVCTACGADSEQPVSADAGCSTAPAVSIASRVDTLNIIVETSGSMKGFMPTQSRQTAFQQQVDDILANAESNKEAVGLLRLYTAQDNIRPIGYDRFQSMLRQGLAQAGASTPIPNLLSQIAGRYASQGQVSIFISDFIYSPPNTRDRDYVSNDIRRALLPLQDKGMVVAVYGFQSEFRGTFYPAGSKASPKASPVANCCETDIPYYVWIIGPEPAVRMMAARLFRSPVAASMQSGYARRAPAYGVVPGSGRSGSWYLAGDAQTILIDNTQELRQGEVSFSVGLNLEALPSQYRTPDYLSRHLQVQSSNGTTEVEGVWNRQDFSEKEQVSTKDRQLLECYTHLVKLKVASLDDRNSPLNLRLTLPANRPQWAEAWTTDDDRNPNDSGPRTFALTEILEGVRRLYPQEREPVFALDLSIKKAN